MAPRRVAVIGGGVMGAAAAWRLTRRGAEVVCFDRHSPPHPFGSSHGDSRIFRTAYMEGAWYVPLLQEALPLWRELEADSARQVLTLTGALMIGRPESKTVAGALKSAREHGLDVQLLESDDLRRQYPAHVTGDGEVAVLDRAAGFVRPESAVASMLSLAGSVRPETIVGSVAEALVGFDSVVVAAGPWTPELIEWLPLTVERQLHGWFAIGADPEPFTPARFPVFIRESKEFGHVYGVPTLDGVSVKIGRHHQGETTDPHTIRREVDEADLAPLLEVVAGHIHGLSGRVTRTLTCMYTNTPDEHFVIDFHPDDRRVVILSPCSGHGFKFAPVIGDIAADLVLDGGTRRDVSRFSAARFARTPS